MKNNHSFLLVLTMLLTSLFVNAQDITISGYIQDADSGEKLIGVNIYDAVAETGTVTNTFGFFSYTCKGQAELNISYVGYSNHTVFIDSQKDTLININLNSETVLDQVEISATKTKKIQEESQMSTIEVPILQIKSIPALLGEVDVLKAMQLLPGVQSGGEGQSGFYVRGGSPDQNLILLDGIPVYNASHLFGFFSVFNADAIKDVKLIKGGFPARYGGRLSSVLEINMKEGNSKEFKGSGSIGLVSSKLTLEGPIVNDKTSFIVSGRRTYIDLLAKPFIKKGFSNDGQSGDTGYYFYDVNAKINHKFSDRDRLYFSFYGGEDKFFFNTKENFGDIRDIVDTGLDWGNTTAALRWNHLVTNKLFINSALTFSKYNLDTRAKYGTEYVDNFSNNEEISLAYISGITDIAARVDVDYVPNPDHYIKYGLNTIFHTFRPGKFTLKQIDPSRNENYDLELGQDNISTTEYAAYVEDDYKVNNKIKINAGLHFSGFNVQGKNYVSLQPRLSSRFLIDDKSSFKASFATMRQYIHLLSFEGIGLPTDLWLPTTRRVKPQDAWQAAIGYAQTIGEYELSVEGYYKEMKNVISYKDGSGVFEFSDWEDRVTQGNGKSYGVELLLQKKLGRLNGWLGYTLSWSKRQFDDLNFGKEFPYRYDRRHDISLVMNYKLSEKVSLAGSWVYGTGNAITLANSNYSGLVNSADRAGLFTASYYKDRNNFRMNAYHRLDFGINFTKKKKNFERTWSFGAYNAYNRKNPFYIYTDYDYETRSNKLKQASLFPIIPYFTYSFKF